MNAPPAAQNSTPQNRAIPVTVIRHRRERISKCSLRFLHERPEFTFLSENDHLRFDGSGYLLLDVDAPTLSLADAGSPLLLLDATWRWLPQVQRCVVGTPIRRSLPPVATAYPRVTKIFEDPQNGLASVEAVYLAKRLLGENDPTLLTGYRWAEQFLQGLEE